MGRHPLFAGAHDRRGDQIDARMDRKGARIDHRLDRRGDRIDRWAGPPR